MVMRQTGNYRLLLNAKVFAGMASQLMPGGGGVTFGCANHAVAPVAADGATPVSMRGVKNVDVHAGM